MGEGRSISEVRLATGVTVRYVASGADAGTPVLLLHAWGESRGSFDRLIPLLPAHLRVFAPDQRGHGDAEKPDTAYSLHDFADDVVALMDALELPSAVLLGSSSGGYVAQQVAVSNPERVSALVLVGSPRSLQGRPPFADDVEQLTDPVSEAWVRNSLQWFPLLNDVPEWYLEDRVRDGVRMPAHVWRHALTGLMTATPPTEAGTITAPTLVIYGGHDQLLARADQEALAAVAQGRLIVYDETGHLVLWEQPAQVAEDCTAFVHELTSRKNRVED